MTYVLVKQANIASDDGLQTSVIFFLLKHNGFHSRKLISKFCLQMSTFCSGPNPFLVETEIFQDKLSIQWLLMN